MDHQSRKLVEVRIAGLKEVNMVYHESSIKIICSNPYFCTITISSLKHL